MSVEENSSQNPKALIYCRVSSKKQKNEGHGLESQETRCREYALAKGYEVEAVFPDDVSGGGDFMNRPGMVALLTYIDVQTDKNYVVIFDDLKRFARDTEFHIKLRRAFKVRGAQVECLNFKFEDSPEGRFIETIIAAQGALEREQNGRQVIQKMRARMKSGYWVFAAPVAYKYGNQRAHGKILVRDEPLASIVQEGLEGYAMGRFDSQAEVKRFFDSQPEFPKGRYGEVTHQRVTRILAHPIYAGYISHERWDIHLIKGQHEPLISLEVFETIQKRRSGALLAPARKNINLDFPLRGFVLCDDCKNPFTACWSKGKSKKYPYYICGSKGCDSYKKSVPRAQIEGDFDVIVKSLQPTNTLLTLAKEMFKHAWGQRAVQTKERLLTFKHDKDKLEKQISGLLKRIMDSSNSTVIAAYEAEIGKLECERRIMDEKLQKGDIAKNNSEEFIEHALQFLANPWNIWSTGQFTLKQMVLRLAFSERISYSRNKGYRTPKTSLPFKVLEGFSGVNKCLVDPSYLEHLRQ